VDRDGVTLAIDDDCIVRRAPCSRMESNLRPKGLLSGKEAETWTSSSASREKNPGRQLVSPGSVERSLPIVVQCMFGRKEKNSRGKQLSAPYDGLDLIGTVSAFYYTRRGKITSG
jgi:hypothetical protein